MQIINFFKNFYIKNLVKKQFRKLFKNKYKKESGIILIEFNKWTSTHVSIAYAASVLAKKYNSRIYAYAENGFSKLLFGFSFLDRLYIKLNKYIKLKTYSIYSSFGVEKFIETDKINLEIQNKFQKNIIQIKKKIKTKNDLVNLKIENILIGDLVYDTYLRTYKLPTVDLNSSQFQNFLEKSVIYFYLWDQFFKNNKVKGVIVSQAVYNSTIPIRIGLEYNCICLASSPNRVTKLSKQVPYAHNENLTYKKLFLKLDINQKKLALKKTRDMLKISFEENPKISKKELFLSSNSYRKKSFVSKNKYAQIWSKKRSIKKSKRLKILICPHALSDAPHTRGFHLFSDFYEWLVFILEISNKTNYDWYLKLHPDLNQYWDKTEIIVKDLIKKKYKNVEYLDNKTPHTKIISEGINFAVTCAGSVCAEYAYFKIPTINSSFSNPHIDFSFSVNPKNITELEKILLNLKNFKKKFNKKELLIYFFMSEFYYSDNWLFQNWKDILEFCSDRTGLYRDIFYHYWISNFNLNLHERSIKGLEKFIESNDHRLNFIHLGDSFNDHLNRFEY